MSYISAASVRPSSVALLDRACSISPRRREGTSTSDLSYRIIGRWSTECHGKNLGRHVGFSCSHGPLCASVRAGERRRGGAIIDRTSPPRVRRSEPIRCLETFVGLPVRQPARCYAAECLLAGGVAVDEKLEAAIGESVAGLAAHSSALGVAPQAFFAHAVPLMVHYGSARQTAEVSLAKTLGPQASEDAVLRLAGRLTALFSRVFRQLSSGDRGAETAQRPLARAVGGAVRGCSPPSDG